MKLNWGTFIAIGYSTFVLFIVFMVYSAFGENYDLVTKDYYAQEIAYQSKIDKKTRAENLDTPLQTIIEGTNLKVLFPQKNSMIAGEVQCFRPSDESKDFTVPFSTKNGSILIPLKHFTKGKYRIKVDWNLPDEAEKHDGFYKEQVIVIP